MHKSPVLRNYPINNAPEGVKIVTYDYMIQILKILKLIYNNGRQVTYYAFIARDRCFLTQAICSNLLST